jgi:single-strand DNA-binding protein
MINRVVLVGRMTRDPELRYTPSGVAVTRFRIAVNRPLNPNNIQEGQQEADFFDCVAWRQTAESVGNHGSKGRLVAVDGRLQQRSWVGQDGFRRDVVEIIAERVRFLDRRPEASPSLSADREAVPEAEVLPEPDVALDMVADEPEDPFADQ